MWTMTAGASSRVPWEQALAGAVFTIDAYAATVCAIIEASEAENLGTEVEEHARLRAFVPVLGRQLVSLGFESDGTLRAPGIDGEGALRELLGRFAAVHALGGTVEDDLVHCLASGVSHLLSVYGTPTETQVRPLTARGADPLRNGRLRLDGPGILVLELTGT